MNSAFVLGIDGLPFSLANRLISEGVMPNLAELTRSGTLAQMNTTVPDFSCVAWTSFATGVNPGKHGIYGFQDFHPDTGEVWIPDATDCKSAPLWHDVGNAGGRSIVFNLPSTYPALPLKGKMVSGFVAPSLEKACYPPNFAQTMRTLDYKMDLDGVSGLGDANHVEEHLWSVFEARKKAIRHLIANEYWDLCIAVITETDRLQHYFLHTLEDENHEKHQWTRNFYRELDLFVGEIADRINDRAALYLVSDHGFSVIEQEIVLQDILFDLGLVPKSKLPIWMDRELVEKSKVLAMDPGRFYINYAGGRFPGGTVKPGDAEVILADIVAALEELTSPKTGEKIVSLTRRKDSGFWGPQTEYAPDLIAATNPGYYFKSFRLQETENIRDSHWEANHVWNDAIFYAPGDLVSDRKPEIWDVMPTVLSRMNVSSQTDIDGRSLFVE